MSTPAPTPPTASGRHVVGSYGSYAEAERAVDFLSDEGFPVQELQIIGTGLKTVEQVAGRLTTSRAAITGAGQGALLGVVFALLFGIFFSGAAFLGLLVYAVVLGAIVGAVLSAVTHAAQGGTRDFASFRGMQASQYDVQASSAHADEARRLLERLPAR